MNNAIVKVGEGDTRPTNLNGNKRAVLTVIPPETLVGMTVEKTVAPDGSFYPVFVSDRNRGVLIFDSAPVDVEGNPISLFSVLFNGRNPLPNASILVRGFIPTNPGIRNGLRQVTSYQKRRFYYELSSEIVKMMDAEQFPGREIIVTGPLDQILALSAVSGARMPMWHETGPTLHRALWGGSNNHPQIADNPKPLNEAIPADLEITRKAVIAGLDAYVYFEGVIDPNTIMALINHNSDYDFLICGQRKSSGSLDAENDYTASLQCLVRAHKPVTIEHTRKSTSYTLGWASDVLAQLRKYGTFLPVSGKSRVHQAFVAFMPGTKPWSGPLEHGCTSFSSVSDAMTQMLADIGDLDATQLLGFKEGRPYGINAVEDPLIAVLGPQGGGKTTLALDLAATNPVTEGRFIHVELTFGPESLWCGQMRGASGVVPFLEDPEECSDKEWEAFIADAVNKGREIANTLFADWQLNEVVLPLDWRPAGISVLTYAEFFGMVDQFVKNWGTDRYKPFGELIGLVLDGVMEFESLVNEFPKGILAVKKWKSLFTKASHFRHNGVFVTVTAHTTGNINLLGDGLIQSFNRVLELTPQGRSINVVNYVGGKRNEIVVLKNWLTEKAKKTFGFKTK